MSSYRNILKLSAWDMVAKAAYFLACLYLARIMGVEHYGVWEFAISVMAYFLLIADFGMEVWATREATKGGDIPALVGTVMPLRLMGATGALGMLLAILPLLPDFPQLRTVLVVFGLTLFLQAANLKWVFMGQERMATAGKGLALTQLVFAVGIVVMVRSPNDLIWAPLLKGLGDLAAVSFFGRQFLSTYGSSRINFNMSESLSILRHALPMGVSNGLGLLSYNCDTLLLGFLSGPSAVGFYNAAYRPVTALLALPLTYFQGLFPLLSRKHHEDRQGFIGTLKRSLGLAGLIAFPIGVSGMFLGAPVLDLLFGPAYRQANTALQILVWSAVLVILRGSYRQAFIASGRQTLDLRCAGISATFNLGLNVLLIPPYGIIGAAAATVVGDCVWLTLAALYCNWYVVPVPVCERLSKPLLASVLMGGSFMAFASFHWVSQAIFAWLVYLGSLWLMGEKEVRSWVLMVRAAT